MKIMDAKALVKATETKRKSKELKAKYKIKSPLKAIRAKCINCSGGRMFDADNCVIPDCPLFPYRKGRNPAPDTMRVAQFDINGKLVGYEEL